MLHRAAYQSMSILFEFNILEYYCLFIIYYLLYWLFIIIDFSSIIITLPFLKIFSFDL